MSNRDQKTNVTLVRTKSKSMRKSDYLRINLLFVKWRNWLYYLTFVYFFIYLVWQSINRKIRDFCFSLDAHSEASHKKNAIISWKTLPVLAILGLVRGLVFCADGIVSSWLKSPFGQITYSINKSGIESSKSDEIITILTEINEHFKETFKKFGIYAISTDIVKIIRYTALGSYNREEKLSPKSGLVRTGEKKEAKGGVNIEPEDIGLLSLLVPVFYAYWRIIAIEKTIKNLEFEND